MKYRNKIYCNNRRETTLEISHNTYKYALPDNHISFVYEKNTRAIPCAEIK